jgi:hypothetical protein
MSAANCKPRNDILKAVLKQTPEYREAVESEKVGFQK